MPPTADSSLLAEAHALSARLIQVSERARADFAVAVATVGLTPVQARAVLFLEQPTPMRVLAEHLSCDASNVTGLADRLEALGVVDRVAGADRRIKLLRLTERGAALRAELAEQVGSRSTVTAKLSSSERNELAGLLDKLLA